MIKKIVLMLAIIFSGLVITDSSIIFQIKNNVCFAEEFNDETDSFGEDEMSQETFPEVDFSVTENVEISSASKFSSGGFVKQSAEYGFNKNDNKLSKLKSALSADISYKISPNWYSRISGYGYFDFAYKINGRDKYIDETLDDNESELNLRECFIDGKLSENTTIKAGRQIIAWGESDFSRVNDIVNPRDMKQPGLTNLEDARLPVAAIKLSYESDKNIVAFLTIHEQYGSSISTNGSDYDYFSSLRMPGITINEEESPDTNIENTGFAFRFTRMFNGGDISFYAGETFARLPVLTADSIEFAGPALQSINLTPNYFKYRMFGISGKKTNGSLLYKFESAFLADKEIMRNDFTTGITPAMTASMLDTNDEIDQLKLLLGIEYSGISNLRLSLEAENIHTPDYKGYYIIDKNNISLFFQSVYTLLNNTLELDLFWVYLNRGDGNILRLSANYDIIDNLNLEAGIIIYDAASKISVLHPYKEQDRIFTRIKYSF